MNKLKLLGKMTEMGYTQKNMAAAIQMSENTFSSRINGKSAFDTREISKICDLLHIDSDVEKSKIFLNQTSQKRDDYSETEKGERHEQTYDF